MSIIRRHIVAMSGLRQILDAGCGEGYYLGRLKQALASEGQASYVGMDISKEAVRMAAKRYKQALFVVADLTQRFVLADQSINAVLNIFAPRNPAEFARVIVPGGVLLVVIPETSHLLSLRTQLSLLTIQEQKQQHVISQLTDAFELVETSSIVYPLHLERQAIQQVVMMTPNYWHQTDEMRETIQHIDSIETSAAFTMLLFRRV